MNVIIELIVNSRLTSIIGMSFQNHVESASNTFLQFLTSSHNHFDVVLFSIQSSPISSRSLSHPTYPGLFSSITISCNAPEIQLFPSSSYAHISLFCVIQVAL